MTLYYCPATHKHWSSLRNNPENEHWNVSICISWTVRSSFSRGSPSHLCLLCRTCRLCSVRFASWCFQWPTGAVSTALLSCDFSWERLSHRLPSSLWVTKATSCAHVRSPVKVNPSYFYWHYFEVSFTVTVGLFTLFSICVLKTSRKKSFRFRFRW